MKWVVEKYDGTHRLDCFIFFRRGEISAFHKLMFKLILKFHFKKSQRNLFLLFTIDNPPVVKILKLFRFAVAIASRYFHILSTHYCLLSKKSKVMTQSSLPDHLVKINSSSCSQPPLFFITSFCFIFCMVFIII